MLAPTPVPTRTPTRTPTAECFQGDANHDGQITIDEILTAIHNALNGCAMAGLGLEFP